MKRFFFNLLASLSGSSLRFRPKKTYTIGVNGKWIACHKCGRVSYNSNDVEHRYCGHCHQFHE